MIDSKMIKSIISESVERLNVSLDVGIENKADAPILADGGIDSFSFVCLISDLEERIHEKLGVEVSLINDDVLNSEKQPFNTLGTIEDYLYQVLR